MKSDNGEPVGLITENQFWRIATVNFALGVIVGVCLGVIGAVLTL